jgi:hypothetical protein
MALRYKADKTSCFALPVHSITIYFSYSGKFNYNNIKNYGDLIKFHSEVSCIKNIYSSSSDQEIALLSRNTKFMAC